MDDNGDRQRIIDLERRMDRVEAGISGIGDQIGEMRLEMRVEFARLKERQEAEDRARRHDSQEQAAGLGSLVSTPTRQAAAILGTLLAAIVAAVLQLLGVELGSGG